MTEIPEQAENSVVSDNFLVYSAIRAIGQQDNFVYSMPVNFSSFKVVFDLCSLAALAELLVLHDTLFTDPATMIWECSELAEVISAVPPEVTEPCLNTALEALTLRVTDYRDYCRQVLSQIPLESCILEILGEYGGARDYDAVMAMEFQERIDHHRVKLGGFLLGALYYEQVSAALDLPYVPHPSRAHAVLFEMTSNSAVDPRTLVEQLLKIIDDSRRKSALKINEFVGNQMFDPSLPAVFGAVLKKSTHREDIIVRAMEMRESGAGRSLRSWMRGFLMDLRTGDLGKVGSRIGVLDEIRKELVEEKHLPTSQGVQVSVGPLKIDPTVGTVGRLLNRMTSNRKLRMLRLLSTNVMTIKTISAEVERLFGSGPAQALMAFPSAIDPDVSFVDAMLGKGFYSAGFSRKPARVRANTDRPEEN